MSKSRLHSRLFCVIMEKTSETQHNRKETTMNTKRTLALLLSVLMMLSVFVSCSGEEPGEKDPSKEQNNDSTGEKDEILRGAASSISLSDDFIIALRNDGSVLSAGGNSSVGAWQVDSFRGIVKISAGTQHCAALRDDGRVFAAGYNGKRQCETGTWTDIVDIHAGLEQTYGLKADGTVIMTTASGESAFLTGWSGIVSLSGKGDRVYGLTGDGDVYARPHEAPVASGVEKVFCNASYAIFLMQDGSLQFYGDSVYVTAEEVEAWTNVTFVSSCVSNHVVALKKDGTVVAAGQNQDGRCDVAQWSDIVSVATGSYHTVGLKSDGTVVATGNSAYGQCDVSDWRNIVAVFACDLLTVGLKEDGTVVATGSMWNSLYDSGINQWTDVSLD